MAFTRGYAGILSLLLLGGCAADPTNDPHGGGFYQNIGHTVRSYNSMIATGGHFPVMGEVALNNVAVVNNNVFQELSGGAYNEMQEEFPAFVYALAASGGNLFVGGNFTVVGKAE